MLGAAVEQVRSVIDEQLREEHVDFGRGLRLERRRAAQARADIADLVAVGIQAVLRRLVDDCQEFESFRERAAIVAPRQPVVAVAIETHHGPPASPRFRPFGRGRQLNYVTQQRRRACQRFRRPDQVKVHLVLGGGRGSNFGNGFQILRRRNRPVYDGVQHDDQHARQPRRPPARFGARFVPQFSPTERFAVLRNYDDGLQDF